MEPVLKIVTGPPRVGKTCRVVRRLVEDFLPFHDATYYTNLPLYVDVIADRVAPLLASRRKCSIEEAREEVFRRVVLIPREVLDDWYCGDVDTGFRQGQCPAAWFGDRLRGGDVIALDEAHCYIPKEADKEFPGFTHEWKVWISQIGHPGAHLELMTQDQHMISAGLRSLGAVIVHLSPVDETRDKLTGLLIDDWWQFVSKWKRKAAEHVSGYIEVIFQKKGNRFSAVPNDDGEMSRLLRFKPEWFECYNSNNAREGHEGDGYDREMPACQRLSWPFFLMWFWRRNATALSTRLGAIGLVFALLLMFLIGGTSVISGPMRLLAYVVSSSAGAAAAEPGKAPAAASVGGVSSPSSAPVPSAKQLSQDVARESVDRLLWEGAIVLLSQRHIIFQDGQLVRVGETINGGFYKGRVLKRVDLGRRLCQLDDGNILQIGRSTLASPPAASTREKARPGGSAPRPAGAVAGPQPDPKFNQVGAGIGGVSGVPVTPARPQSQGAGAAGGSRSASPGSGRQLGSNGASGSGPLQGGASGVGQSGRSGSAAGGGSGRASTDKVRAGSNQPPDGYITPARRGS